LGATRIRPQLQAIREPDAIGGDTPSTRRIGLGTISNLGELSPDFVIDAIKEALKNWS
jgi:uncharacterized FAD-dependent dehydrogenase